MRSNKLLGLIYANVHEDLIPELTSVRSMASLPFAGRYRLIDFSLSNLVNAGVTQVGIITKANYQSLMDHVGNGKAYDLDRKAGGLFILPPFSTADSDGKVYEGHLDALAGIITFLRRASQEYVVLCDSDVVSSLDLSLMMKQHKETKADFTIAYKHGRLPKNHKDIMVLERDGNRVTGISFPNESESVDYSLNITIVKRELLIELVEETKEKGYTSLSRHLLAHSLNRFQIYGYAVTGFAEVMDSTQSYFKLNKKMLESRSRKQLFCPERPIYTKTHDRMPTRYGLSCRVENSLIADGCRIEGTVKNSVIFRNVTIEQGAVVEDSIVMQGAVIEKNATVRYAILDKQAVVTQDVTAQGSAAKLLLAAKGERIE